MECTIYSNTGFNGVNVADSASLLNDSATTVFTTEALDCIQSRFLSSITIKATAAELSNADYCVVDDFYYSISGFTMTSYDVAQISLVPDFITSFAAKYDGVSSLKFLDGVTERYHIPQNEDTFGTFTQADPLLSPAYPLQINVAGPFGDTTPTDTIDVVESAVDLAYLGDPLYNLVGTAYTAEYTTSGSESGSDETQTTGVVVPSVPYVTADQACTFTMGGYTTKTNGTALFLVSDAYVRRGIQRVRDLGIEDGIIAQYSLPSSLFTVTRVVDEASTAEDLHNVGRVATVTETTSTFDLSSNTSFNFEYTTVSNKRVLYGENNLYGLLSASGSRSEYKPEEISLTTVTAPQIIVHADGRYNGKPYYSYDRFHGLSKTSLNNFFLNSVPGMEWRNLPLRYVTKSGSTMDEYLHKSEITTEVNAYNANTNKTTSSMAGSILKAISSILGGTNEFTHRTSEQTLFGPVYSGSSGPTAATGAGWVMTGANLGLNIESSKNDWQNYIDEWRNTASKELANFGYSQTVVTPTIMFPFQTPSVRDYMGNGIIAYRYRPDGADLIRMDKLLTAYGYAITAQLDSSMLSSRTNFNYIKANGVSIGNDIPNWWKEGITDQFANGIRIWHVKPSATYITERNNP